MSELLNKVTKGDCLEILCTMDDCSVDLTVTSPPYDNLRTYKGYSFDFESIARELYRVTKDGGVVVWVVGDATIKGSETGTSFKHALYFMECGFKLHDTMVFAKNNPVPQFKTKRYTNAFEYMFILSKGKPNVCNYITEQTKNAGQVKSRNGKGAFSQQSADRPRDEKTIVKTDKIKTNIWQYNVGNATGDDKLKSQHPATFPDALANDHIISWSNPGDVVLDIFGGSGTTAKMAILNDRNFIHLDISEEYCEIAQRRIDEALATRN